MAELLSLRQYAAHKGVTLKAVQKAIADHRIETTDLDGVIKIDAELADKQWLERTSKPKQVKNEDVESYHKSKAEKEYYLAQLAKLDYRARTKELLESEDVKATITKLNSIAKQHLMNIPAHCAPDLASMSDIYEITAYLNSKINLALERLVNSKDFETEVTTDDQNLVSQTT